MNDHKVLGTVGHTLAMLITPGDRPEREGAEEMLDQSLCHHGWLRKLWVDGGFSGEDFANHVKGLSKVMDVEGREAIGNGEGIQGLAEALGGRGHILTLPPGAIDWRAELSESETPQIGIGGLAELAPPNLPFTTVGSGRGSVSMPRVWLGSKIQLCRGHLPCYA